MPRAPDHLTAGEALTQGDFREREVSFDRKWHNHVLHFMQESHRKLLHERRLDGKLNFKFGSERGFILLKVQFYLSVGY